jgi:uncharacterized cupin superfamily protein
VEEARLVDTGSGLVPQSAGWFVVNAGETAWLRNDAFGWRSAFEAGGPVLRARPELEPHGFDQIGIRLQVLEPGKPTGLYHAETQQEAFLVLSGECLLLVEEEERRLRAWDFFHCPAGTRHVFVGVEEPCVILMTGARMPDATIVYPESDLARSHGAGVEAETDSPHEAYEPFGHWQLGDPGDALPWTRDS